MNIRFPLLGLVPLVLFTAIGSAEELKLSRPDGDAVPVLREAIERCRDQKISRLVLEPGVWNLHPEKAKGAFRHISNHDPGYKRMAINLDGFSDFEIDGGGATLLCHGVIMPLAIDNSRNITIRNLTIDWDKPFHLEGTVTGVGEDYFEVDMLPECRVILKDGKMLGGVADGLFGGHKHQGEIRQDFTWNYWIDPKTGAAAAKQGHVSHWSKKTKDFAEISKIGPNKFRIRNAHKGVLPDVGTIMICKGASRQNRLCSAFHANRTDGLLAENITVHHASGMGLIVEDCTDPVIRNFNVVRKSDSKSMITTTADATHFVGCRGTVTVENCTFESMLDDSCNVHGIYALSEGLLAPDQLSVSFSHFQQLGTVFARPGDRLRLIDRTTLLNYGEEFGVKSVERKNEDYYVITLDRSIKDEYRDNSSVENMNTRCGLVFRGNTIRNNRARGILVTAGGKVVIEKNRFERPSMSAVLIEGDNHVWYESGAVRDVTIRNNTFIGHSSEAPLFKLAPMQPGQKELQAPYHRNIRIVDNNIEAACPVLVDALRVKGLEFKGNKVKFGGNAAGSAESAVILTACEDVTLKGNEYSRPATLEAVPEETVVKIEDGKLSRKSGE